MPDMRPWDTKLPISKSCWRRFIEAFLEVADDTKDFVEGGHFAEEHFAAHFLIVLAPGFKVVSGRQESERTGMERGVMMTTGKRVLAKEVLIESVGPTDPPPPQIR